MAATLLRSALFVPGNRPERFDKALASGADAVIVDLEDAVPAADKAAARENLRQYLRRREVPGLCVRINGVDSGEHAADAELCAAAGVAVVVLPKAASVDAVTALAQRTGKAIWPLVESAAGVLAVPQLARARGVQRLSLGTLDLMQDLGWVSAHSAVERALERIRCDLAVQSRAAGLQPPVDSVFPALDDDAGLRCSAERARALGFAGMLCIHPRQVPLVNAAFAPSDDEVDWAQRVLEATSGGAAVVLVDGAMVDAPVIARARRILEAAH